MTVVLGIDLAWAGPTGWCLWDSNVEDPIVRYGDLTARGKGNYRALKLSLALESLLGRGLAWSGEFSVAYERTDWHRTLWGLGESEFLKQYAIERRAQRSLGRAEAAMMIAASRFGMEALAVGANEVAKEFGARAAGGLRRKISVAKLIALEWPRFRLINDSDNKAGSYLYDTDQCIEMSHHVSDAIAICSVVARRLSREEMIAAA